MDPHGPWLQFKDVYSAEESTWLDSSGLKLDWFTWSSPTVSTRATGTVKHFQQCALTRKLGCNGMGHFGLILRRSEPEFQPLAGKWEVESSQSNDQ